MVNSIIYVGEDGNQVEVQTNDLLLDQNKKKEVETPRNFIIGKFYKLGFSSLVQKQILCTDSSCCVFSYSIFQLPRAGGLKKSLKPLEKF